MSYVINNSRGQVIAVVADGTINQSATSLALVGRSVNNYGEYENENYVFLLENSANDTAPNNAIVGQIWYDTSTDTLAAYSTANSWVLLATQDYVQAQKISPVFTGIPQAPTASTGTATTQLATTAFVTSSPAFTGVPTAPTASTGTATTQLATTAFVTNSPAFAGSPTATTAPSGTANTRIATTEFVTNSPALAGVPTAPTAGPGTSTTQLATTAFVTLAIGNKETANTQLYGNNSTYIATTAFVQGEKFSPTFTGVPKAPTASNVTANTQIASTAFVNNAVLEVTNVLGTISVQNANLVTITGGNITGITDITIADGGTGASTALQARINLGIESILTGLGTISTQNANAVNITGGDIANITDIAIADGGTGASTASAARTNLGLGTIATQNANAVTITGGDITGNITTSAVTITGGNITGITDIAIADGGTGASTAADARTNLGLGTIATQNANAVNITGGGVFNITDLAIADGGTGASTASAARTNLGLGNIATQNFNNVSITGGTITGNTITTVAATITGGTITGITDIAIADGGTGASTALQARINLGIESSIANLGTMSAQNSNAVSITGGSITSITPLSVGDGGTGAGSASSARTNLGLGTIATQNSSSVAITGGYLTGITDIAIADGGTGASTADIALINLGGVPTFRSIIAGGGLTGTGSLSSDVTLAIATTSNGYATRYVSTSAPSGGVNGDIWYQIQ